MANGSDEKSAAGNVDRRTLIAGAAAIGATLLMAGPGAGVATQMERAARPVPRRRRVGRSRADQRHPVDPAALRRGDRGTLHGRSRARSRFPRVVADGARAGAGRSRLDVPRAGRRAQAGDGLLVPLHRRQRRRQPGRPHDHRAARQRPAPRPLRLRVVQQRQRRRAERLSPDDLGGRARAGRPQARLRAPSRRLHLRSRRISRRGAAPLFAHRLRPRPHSRRAARSAISTCRPTSPAIAMSIARISTIPTSRTRARISRSCASATITNSRGRAGRASSNTAARSSPRSRCASPPTRRGGNISRRACARPRAPGSTSSARPR